MANFNNAKPQLLLYQLNTYLCVVYCSTLSLLSQAMCNSAFAFTSCSHCAWRSARVKSQGFLKSFLNMSPPLGIGLVCKIFQYTRALFSVLMFPKKLSVLLFFLPEFWHSIYLTCWDFDWDCMSSIVQLMLMILSFLIQFCIYFLVFLNFSQQYLILFSVSVL